MECRRTRRVMHLRSRRRLFEEIPFVLLVVPNHQLLGRLRGVLDVLEVLRGGGGRNIARGGLLRGHRDRRRRDGKPTSGAHPAPRMCGEGEKLRAARAAREGQQGRPRLIRPPPSRRIFSPVRKDEAETCLGLVAPKHSQAFLSAERLKQTRRHATLSPGGIQNTFYSARLPRTSSLVSGEAESRVAFPPRARRSRASPASQITGPRRT